MQIVPENCITILQLNSTWTHSREGAVVPTHYCGSITLKPGEFALGYWEERPHGGALWHTEGQHTNKCPFYRIRNQDGHLECERLTPEQVEAIGPHEQLPQRLVA
jgi:hypothetical protein